MAGMDMRPTVYVHRLGKAYLLHHNDRYGVRSLPSALCLPGTAHTHTGAQGMGLQVRQPVGTGCGMGAQQGYPHIGVRQ